MHQCAWGTLMHVLKNNDPNMEEMRTFNTVMIYHLIFMILDTLLIEQLKLYT